MLTLYLIRHGYAEPLSSSGEDSKRALTEEGKALLNQTFADSELRNLASPDLILCSPALRTRQTAEIFLQTAKTKPESVSFREVLYENNAEKVLDSIRHESASVSSLAVIGHNPSLEIIAGELSLDPVLSVSPGTVLVFEFPKSIEEKGKLIYHNGSF